MLLFRAILIAITAGLATLALENWDPFGAASAGQEALERTYFNATAAIYPHESRPKSVAVLVTDADLLAANIEWPMPYQQHASLLRATGIANARAVLIDFFFAEDRLGTDLLIDQLETLACQLPVFMIQPPPQTRLAQEWADFYQRHTDSSSTDCSIILVDAFRRNQDIPYSYPLGKDGGLDSGAEAIAKSLDLNTISNAPWLNKNVAQIEWVLPRSVDCEWADSSAIMSSAQGCRDIPRNPFTRTFLQVANALGFSTGQNRIDITTAAPSPMIAISELNSRSGPQFQLLEDSVVFYGAWISGINDVVETPIYEAPGGGGIPAVLLHQMAFDNIVSRKGKVVRPASDSFRQSMSLNSLIIFLNASIFVIVMAVSSGKVIPSALTAAIISYALILVITMQFPMAPAVWLGLPLGFTTLTMSVGRFVPSGRQQ